MPNRRTSEITCVAIEGGGTKGLAHLGALRALSDDLGGLARIKYWAGTSAGSLGALAGVLTAGDVEAMDKMVSGVPYRKIPKNDFGVIRDLWRTARRGGWHELDVLRTWVDGVVERYAGSRAITFAQLARHAGAELYVVVTDLGVSLSDRLVVTRGQRSVVCSSLATPLWRVADAVVASSAIPIFFTPTTIRYGNGEPVPGPDGEAAGFADGGILWNLPIGVFSGRDPDEVLALRLNTPAEITGKLNPPGWWSRRLPIFSLLPHFASGLYDAAQRAGDPPPQFLPRIVDIHTGPHGSTDFRQTEEDRDDLRRRGRLGYESWKRATGALMPV